MVLGACSPNNESAIGFRRTLPKEKLQRKESMKLRRSVKATTADAVGIESLFHLLRRHSSGKRTVRTGEVLLAACRTFRHLAAHQNTVRYSDADLVKELDVRRECLPDSNRPSEFWATATINAYEHAFEAGFRAWPKVNPYDRADCRRAWELGYAKGESSFQEQFAQRRCSVAYSFGFSSGYEGLAKRNPYSSAGLGRAGDTGAAREWRKGFKAGARAAAA